MRIPKRIRLIADFIDNAKRLVDVGTDHGLLACCLFYQEKIKSALLIDNKKGPLSSAMTNIASLSVPNKTSFLLNDGLKDVALDSSDSIVIAGMGTETIIGILDEANIQKDTLLYLQPMTKLELIKSYLEEHNFLLLKQEVLVEKRKYDIIKAKKA